MGWTAITESRVKRTEHFQVITGEDGLANITFSEPFTNPHISMAVKAERSDERPTWAEWTGLTSTGVTIKTTLAGGSASLLGIIAFQPPKAEDATVHVTVTEIADES